MTHIMLVFGYASIHDDVIIAGPDCSKRLHQVTNITSWKYPYNQLLIRKNALSMTSKVVILEVVKARKL